MVDDPLLARLLEHANPVPASDLLPLDLDEALQMLMAEIRDSGDQADR